MSHFHRQTGRPERPTSLLSPYVGLLLCLLLIKISSDWTTAAYAQKQDIKLLTPTAGGSSGLFTLPKAETVRRGEISFGLSAHRFHRDPGALSFTIFPIAFSAGIHDRIEIFTSFEGYKRIGAQDVLIYKGTPEGTLLPAYISSAQTIGYFNDAPFVDVPFGDGAGDLWAGAKFNLLSEGRNNCLDFALQSIARFPTSSHTQRKLRGLTPGVFDAGLDIVASKRLKDKGTVAGKIGFLSGRNVDGIDRQHQLGWGAGLEWALIKPSLYIIGEFAGEKFLGEKAFDFVDVAGPLEAYVGFRIRGIPRLALSAALNFRLSENDPKILPSSQLGWIFQASIQRKINRPPTIECLADRRRVVEGDTVHIRVKLLDPDDDVLWLSWKSSGGHLTPRDSFVILDTAGLDEGRYSVMAEAGDDTSVASCSVDIDVVTRN